MRSRHGEEAHNHPAPYQRLTRDSRAPVAESILSLVLSLSKGCRRAPWPSATRQRPIVKVGQTFLSALLVSTQRFVRLPLSSQGRGPGGEVLLPKCRQKNGLRRLYSRGDRPVAPTRGRAVRLLRGSPPSSGRSANIKVRPMPASSQDSIFSSKLGCIFSTRRRCAVRGGA